MQTNDIRISTVQIRLVGKSRLIFVYKVIRGDIMTLISQLASSTLGMRKLAKIILWANFMQSEMYSKDCQFK